MAGQRSYSEDISKILDIVKYSMILFIEVAKMKEKISPGKQEVEDIIYIRIWCSSSDCRRRSRRTSPKRLLTNNFSMASRTIKRTVKGDFGLSSFFHY
uniref:Uncharacterized protein n=1 Tax=Lepeophtheirus salmonis TaxID=72036 RepID=A0A0K2T401_LEPSM